jgi:hypothetical protein
MRSGSTGIRVDMREIIKTNELTIKDIPNDDADLSEIFSFALSFDPKLELGTTDIYKIQYFGFDERYSLQELRRSLFLWQRALNWRSGDVEENDLQTYRRLSALIRNKLANSTT